MARPDALSPITCAVPLLRSPVGAGLQTHTEWLATLRRGDTVRVRTHMDVTMPPAMVTNETPCYVFVGRLKFWRRHGWQVLQQSKKVYRMRLRLVRDERDCT
jgi:hypothetical protein